MPALPGTNQPSGTGRGECSRVQGRARVFFHRKNSPSLEGLLAGESPLSQDLVQCVFFDFPSCDSVLGSDCSILSLCEVNKISKELGIELQKSDHQEVRERTKLVESREEETSAVHYGNCQAIVRKSAHLLF